ncbi:MULTISPECIES: hypothetical protein [unclassified Micromonospora]|uniref:hypothetical protein n=1 Tax=unclassified Micromonospora TaxID=2617518 RepID=UPI0033168EDF
MSGGVGPRARKAKDQVDYKRYGLTQGDPYRHRDLDPRKERDRALLVDFAGAPFDEIEEQLDQAAATGKAAAFLLSGREATGRTSLAKLIAHQYRELHQLGDDFRLIVYDEIDHDSLRRAQEVLKAIRNELMELGGWGEHRDRLLEVVPNGPTRPEILDLQAQAGFLANYMRKRMKPAWTLGLLIEGIQNDDFLDTLAVVFARVDLLVVVTRDDYRTADTADPDRMKERDRWRRWALPVQVPLLSGDDVDLLARNRWQHEAPELECPFELKGIRDTFGARRPPVGRALHWLGWLLEWRLRTYNGDECWPAARNLRIPAQWIEESVQQAESAPPHAEGGLRRVR